MPIAHAAVKLKRRRLWWYVAIYAGAALLGILLLNSAPVESNRPYTALQNTGGILITIAMTVGTVHAFRLRRDVFRAVAPVEPEVEIALSARRRRAEVRELATGDPALAHELRIGRPDLPRSYDDGGLIDVNGVPREALVSGLGITDDEADRVVQARQHLGSFTSTDELAAFAELPPAAIARISDRLLFLPR